MKQQEIDEIHAALSSHLNSGEQVFGVAAMDMASFGAGRKSKGVGFLGIATTVNRLLVVFKAVPFAGSFTPYSILWTDITGTMIAGAFGKSMLTIDTEDQLYLINGPTADLSDLRKQITQICDAVAQAVAEAETTPEPVAPATRQMSPPPSAPPNTSDITDRLAKLAELYQSGALTAQEFAEAKRRLIES